jgi:hypothetical protein
MTWLDVLKFIARLLYTVFRICMVVFFAIILGAFRGASKCRMSSSSPQD